MVQRDYKYRVAFGQIRGQLLDGSWGAAFGRIGGQIGGGLLDGSWGSFWANLGGGNFGWIVGVTFGWIVGQLFGGTTCSRQFNKA